MKRKKGDEILNDKDKDKDKDKDIDIEVLRDKDIPVLGGKDLEKAMEKVGSDNIIWVYECEVCHNIFKPEDREAFKQHGIRYHKINYFETTDKLDEEYKKKYKGKKIKLVDIVEPKEQDKA